MIADQLTYFICGILCQSFSYQANRVLFFPLVRIIISADMRIFQDGAKRPENHRGAVKVVVAPPHIDVWGKLNVFLHVELAARFTHATLFVLDRVQNCESVFYAAS